MVVSFFACLLGNLLFPWLSFFGNTVPVAPIIILVVATLKPSQIFAVGLCAGLALDLSGTSVLGLWTLYYSLAAASLVWFSQTGRLTWWWKVIWLTVVLLMMPIYSQLPRISLFAHPWWLHLTSTIILVALASLPLWLTRKWEVAA